MSEDNLVKQSPRGRERDNYFSQTPGSSQSVAPNGLQATGSNVSSPIMRAKSSSKLRKGKPKPHLKRSMSKSGGDMGRDGDPNAAANHYKLVYSVDDDLNDDIEEEVDDEPVNFTAGNARAGLPKADRDYIEGYQDALRSLQQRRGRSVTSQEHRSSQVQDDQLTQQVAALASGSRNKLVTTPGATRIDVAKVDQDIDLAMLTEAAEDAIRKRSVGTIDENSILLDDDGATGPTDRTDVFSDDNGGGDDKSINSTSSSDTLESLNLRERQDAINSTHPFGIKIWKPSLYKKKRSVATRAEEDIHDYELREPTYRIFWGVLLCNFVWSLTFGLFLYLVCLVGCGLVFLFSGFGFHRSLRRYVKLLYAVAKYWLSPFGIFVLLNKDKNYMDEDELDGRSLVEFQRWREQEEGRLFFAPPRRYTTNVDSRPLLKDHKGRPLSEIYSNLDRPVAEILNESIAGGSSNNNNSNSDPANTSAIDDDIQEDEEETEINDIKKRFFGRGSWSSGRFMFYVFFYVILQPILFILSLFCWLFVFTIPMAKITDTICDHLRRHPLALHFEPEKEYYASQGNEGFQKKRKHQLIIMCTYRCCGFHYYKYTIDGTNIFFINLLFTVAFVIFDFYFLRETLELKAWYTDPTFIFCACLFSVIPLAYFIGQAVASISAQSSMGVGAVINAFFSTIVEIFLYCVALNQSKGKLVEGSLIGSILGGVLLLPGLSMCGGAWKRKTQRYNPRSAGVSSTMLLFAMVIMFAPSMFYQIYGSYEIKCYKCSVEMFAPQTPFVSKPDIGIPNDCTKCRFIQPALKLDSLYSQIIKPFSVIVAFALFVAYVCGLYFTLRTHASLIWATNSHEATANPKREEFQYSARSPSVLSLDLPKGSKMGVIDANSKVYQLPSPSADVAKQRLPTVQSNAKLQFNQLASPGNGPPSSNVVPGTPSASHVPPASTPSASKPSKKASILLGKEELGDDEEGGGHDAPNWSKKKSTVILLGATLAYAIIAEILVDCVDAVLVNFPINPKFLGLTVFALVPNTTEFLNAISFAVSGNVALSMEIGSAYALQVVLIQIPSLVIYTIFKNFDDVNKLFPLVFPRWDIIATLMSIFLFTYIYAEGKSNYFKGVILILIYVVIMIGFWFNDQIEALESFGSVSAMALQHLMSYQGLSGNF